MFTRIRLTLARKCPKLGNIDGTASHDLLTSLTEHRDISWSLIQSPALWAFAFSQGRDGIAFLQAFRAMRRGYANGTFRYAVMVFEKP